MNRFETLFYKYYAKANFYPDDFGITGPVRADAIADAKVECIFCGRILGIDRVDLDCPFSGPYKYEVSITCETCGSARITLHVKSWDFVNPPRAKSRWWNKMPYPLGYLYRRDDKKSNTERWTQQKQRIKEEYRKEKHEKIEAERPDTYYWWQCPHRNRHWFCGPERLPGCNLERKRDTRFNYCRKPECDYDGIDYRECEKYSEV